MGKRRVTAVVLVALSAFACPLAAQDFNLDRCRVAHVEGRLVKIVCGGVPYWVIDRRLASECTALSRDCPAWKHRSGLLDEAVAELGRGKDLLEESYRGMDRLRENEALINEELLELQTDLASQWTFLEVCGVAAITGTAALIAGVLVGVFAVP